MDQYTNYFDTLSQSMYPQQINTTSAFLSSESHPPSLSASPVSSEGSDSLVDESVQYGLFSYDQPPTVIYNSYDQKYIACCYCAYILSDVVSLFSSAHSFMAGSTPVDGHSSPRAIAHHEYSFGYDSHMMFDKSFAPSTPTYQPSIDYPVHSATVSGLTNMLGDTAPFATVKPSATSGPFDEDISTYKLTVDIGELSISTPASSPFFYAESVGSSPPSLRVPESQPIQACDPKELGSPVTMTQPVFQPGSLMQAEGSRRTRAPSYHASNVDSDYYPSGESEVEDETDHDYGETVNRRRGRSARVASAAHPYLKPASHSEDRKGRAIKLQIPTPVPGLTKNSRGRSVPRKTEVVFEDGTRMFWCDVEGCDKLFGRGEHLKRHVTSIHTHDKRE